METITALGYAPNPAARNLAGARGARIGLLYSNPSASHLSEFLLGSLDQCSRAGLQLIVEKAEEASPEVAARGARAIWRPWRTPACRPSRR